MSTLEIAPLERPLDAVLDLPGSKSITNRYLPLAALARGTSRLSRILIADDTEAMLDCIAALGAPASFERDGTTASVSGTDGHVPSEGHAYARQSGTTARFIAPVLALGGGIWHLDGDAQLRARPMGDLFSALSSLGVHVEEEGSAGSLPVALRGPVRGQRTEISGSVSSQFLSGLLLAAPLLADGLEIEVTGSLVSRPYVEMTVAAMRRFGAAVEVGATHFRVAPGGYRAADLEIEPDASGASYFFAVAALVSGRVRVRGLGAASIQGDVGFVGVLERMGATVRRGSNFLEVEGGAALHGVEADLSDMSDMVPTLAVVAALATTPTQITGVGFIRNKESDRIGAFAEQLRRCGIAATEEPDGLLIEPSRPHGALVATNGDHRIAMAFAVLGLVTPGVVIDDPACVAKTFPTFFELLETLRA